MTLAQVLARYFAFVMPLARRELRGWRAAADAIEDDELRRHANATLDDEALLAEAAALFAALVPARHRGAVVRLTVAWQVLYDLLDTLGEQPGCGPIDVGERLYAQLEAPLVERTDDGEDGYVEQLISACRASLAVLPAALVALPALLRATRRCGMGQTMTHAVASAGAGPLIAWSREQRMSGCEWWEVAGGAISSLGVHALFAAAANPSTTALDVERLDQAYSPHICALSTLLDCLIDRYGTDAAAGSVNHGVLRYYRSEQVAAERLPAITRSSIVAARGLPRAHLVIVMGTVAWYLSSPEAWRPENAGIAAAVRDACGPLLAPLMVVLRLRRRVG